MDASVVICTFNRADMLGTTLESLTRLDVPEGVSWELIVVDNNSGDHTPAVVDWYRDRLPARYLFEGQPGKSHALNTGVRHALGEVVAFTDDDVEVDRRWLAALWEVFSGHRCDGVAGRIVAVWDSPQPRWYGDTGPYRLMTGVIVQYEYGEEVREIEALPFGANMAFRRAVLERTGPFRIDLGPVGDSVVPGEDGELCSRVRDAGGLILYAPDAVVYHPVPPERATKRYFQGWYFRHGQYDVRRGRYVQDATKLFGVPLYLLRSLAESAFGWLASLDAKRRFFHRATFFRRLGKVVECVRPSGPHERG